MTVYKLEDILGEIDWDKNLVINLNGKIYTDFTVKEFPARVELIINEDSLIKSE